MFFENLYKESSKILSLEFFPPRFEERMPETLQLIADLSQCRPHYMTVTYGAGGGTRHLTRKIASHITNELNIPAVAHLTCVNHSVEEIDREVEQLNSHGITNILALRGDPPRGEIEFQPHPEGFSNARDLASHLSSKEGISLAVAGYPEVHKEATSLDGDLKYLKEKVNAGAEIVITQLFFDNDFYFKFVDAARSIGISAPIVPGIMPIGNVAQLNKFTSMCGASIPQPLRNSLEKLKSKEDVIRFGIDYASEQCRGLLEGGSPGVHLYTLNKSVQVPSVIEGLGIC